ncbi:MAG TPA: LPXTG cell wall anchor domain-containing protein, partial [Humibacter sp.]|nr:LPXTG cell wall anchor domain-containing protein [Humibacter sp.]
TPGRTWDKKGHATGGLTTVPAQTLTLATYREGGSTPPTIDAPTSARAGAPLTVRVHGFASGASITVVLHSVPLKLGTVTADASGDGELTATVPANFAAGAHVLQASVGGDVVATRSIRITAPAVSSGNAGGQASGQASGTDASGLASTGTNLTLPVALGLLLIAAGTILTLQRRRRRTSR